LTFPYRGYTNTNGMGTSIERRLTRAEGKARTRERLLGAAEAVFRRQGYHGASLDQVAAEAGFTKGAVYSTFESKADLFLALLDRRAAGRRDEFTALLSESDTVEEFVAEASRSFARSVGGERDFWSALIEFMTVVGRDPLLRERFSRHHDASRETVAASISQWMAKNRNRSAIDPRRLATTIISVNNGLTLEGLLSPDEVDVDLYVEAQLALLRGSWVD
jgi:AcrR family transcriptional regulator